MTEQRAAQRVNCRVLKLPGGGSHLVFTAAGTGEVVGEMRVTATAQGWLPVMAELFARFVKGAWTQPSDLATAVKRAINGG